MNQTETININTILDTQVSVPASIIQKWQKYLANDTDPSLYTMTQKHQLSIAEKFYGYEQQGRTLYHMSITYKPFKGRVYGEKDIGNFFINSYTRMFLPYLMETKFYHRSRTKSLQPITYCFTEAGKPKRSNDYTFTTSLHHHAILAVHEDTLDKMDALVGDDTLAGGDFTSKIKTSNIRRCEAQTVLYASKQLKKYPNFMLFPKLKKA